MMISKKNQPTKSLLNNEKVLTQYVKKSIIVTTVTHVCPNNIQTLRLKPAFIGLTVSLQSNLL